MRDLTVSASQTYQIKIGSGLLSKAGEILSPTLADDSKIAVITDDNVELLYADRLECSLTAAGFEVCRFALPHGEEEKNGENYLKLLNFLAREELTRSDAVIALGGGAVGDLAGFAAATYLRGVRFVQVPTTLLAMVDAAIGGKCAVNLTAGKNLAGAFYQPCAVLSDIDCLATLPRAEFSQGCAEILKYAVLGNRTLFDTLLHNGRSFDRETVIELCASAKAAFVCEDELDTGRRNLLNLGHTIGHAIERCSNYLISHGDAVAMGIGIMARSGAASGDCSGEDADRIIEALRALELPSTTNFCLSELLPFLKADKKRRGDRINLAVIREIGCCELREMPLAQAEAYLKAGF